MPEDVEEIVSLEYDLFPENNFGERTLLYQLTRGFCYLLDVDGKTAGYALCSSMNKPLIDILRLGVRDHYRHVGIGTMLLKSVIKLGSDVMLTVKKENTPAINLYRKNGFEIAGMMPQHSSWVMTRPKTTSS